MWRRFIILLLLAPAFGQLATQEITPLLRQSHPASADTNAFNNNVVSGNLLVAWYECSSGGNCASGPSIADTLGSTWHSRITQGSTQCGNMWVWTASANGSGADTVTITNGGTFKNLQVAEYTNAIDTLDVASTATGYSGNGAQTTPSVTTTTNGALLLGAMHTCTAGQISITPNNLPVTNTSGADSMVTAWRVAGAAGSTSMAFNWGGSSTTGNKALIAMKASSGLQVVTTALPNASTSAAYSFQLNANGGSGAYTWSLNSGTLPTGLSLSSAGVISGTATTGNSDAPLVFHVVEAGGSTSANSASLTLHVGVSVNTPALVQNHTSSGCAAFSLGNVTAGNLILIHYLTLINNFNNVLFTDSVSTTYATLPVGNSTQSTTTVEEMRYAWGFAGGTGADTLTCTGAALLYSVAEFSNIQQIFDPAVFVSTQGSGGGSPVTSGSFTTPVVMLVDASINPFTSATTTTAGSGYTLNTSFTGGGNQIATEYNLTAAAGSTTASFTQSGNTDGHWSLSALGFRPTTSGTAASGYCAACDLSWLDVGQQPFTGF